MRALKQIKATVDMSALQVAELANISLKALHEEVEQKKADIASQAEIIESQKKVIEALRDEMSSKTERIIEQQSLIADLQEEVRETRQEASQIGDVNRKRIARAHVFLKRGQNAQALQEMQDFLRDEDSGGAIQGSCAIANLI